MAWLSDGESRPAGAIRRNLVFIWLFNMVWALGNPMVSSATMVASFFDKLGSKPVVFGLLQAAASVPVLIQVLPRLVNLRSRNLRAQMITAYMLAGGGYVLYGAAAYFCRGNAAVFVPVMLGLYFAVFCLYQLAYILYLDYIMQLFPAGILGRFYGVNGIFMSAGSVIGGAAAGVILKYLGFPTNYSVMFMLAGMIFVLSTAMCLFTVPSGPVEPQESFRSIKAYAAYAARIFRQPAARLFAVLVLLIYINQASYGFALIFLNRELGMGVDPTAATIIAYVSQSVLLLVVGVSLDKLGRLKTVSGYMTLVLAANLVILTGWQCSAAVVFAVYGMYALFISMVKVRLANDIMPAGQRLDAVIVANIMGVAANAVLSMLYGWVAGLTGSYRFMFILSAASVIVLYVVAARLHNVIKQLPNTNEPFVVDERGISE